MPQEIPLCTLDTDWNVLQATGDLRILPKRVFDIPTPYPPLVTKIVGRKKVQRTMGYLSTLHSFLEHIPKLHLMSIVLCSFKQYLTTQITQGSCLPESFALCVRYLLLLLEERLRNKSPLHLLYFLSVIL